MEGKLSGKGCRLGCGGKGKRNCWGWEVLGGRHQGWLKDYPTNVGVTVY